MKLWIAGGVGEHGRNCFLVCGEGHSFLVDCGRMADTPEDPYPRLRPEVIRGIDTVFLTHSHADHTGALPWLFDHGFDGAVIAAEETFRELPFTVKNARFLETLCPGGQGNYRGMTVRFGRSGHCAGSVWYHFAERERSFFFSGDYTEDTLVYACDPIRGERADLAILDCAYGRDATSYPVACGRLVGETERLLSERGLVLFPVPKYGRGPEILKLFSERLADVPYFSDDLFFENLAAARAGGFWYRPTGIPVTPRPYDGQARGIVFVCDPQLRSAAARKIADAVLARGGTAVMTGTTEHGSYSETLQKTGKMHDLCYPVHLGYAQYRRLIAENRFVKTIPYHTSEFYCEREIFF